MLLNDPEIASQIEISPSAVSVVRHAG